MPVRATGEALKRNPKTDVFEKRVKLCGKKVLYSLPTCTEERHAQKREAILIKLAAQLTSTSTPFLLARQSLRRVAVANCDMDMDAACEMIRDVLAGWRPNGRGTCPTVDEVFARWQSNEIARMYPDNDLKIVVRNSDTINKAELNFDNYCRQHVGHLPCDEVTLELADRCKAEVAHMLESDSRRQALQPFKRIMDICRMLGYIKVSPLPEGWLPKRAAPKDRRQLQFLYPSEEALLAAGFSPEQQELIRTGTPAWTLTPVVPFEWRVFWAFIVRHGRRKTESTLLEIGQIKWRKNKAVCQLRGDQTKNGKAWTWALDAASTRALRMFVALCRKGAKPTDRMFVTPDGKPINPDSVELPDLLRQHLWAVGVRRPELHTTIAGESRQFCVHDLRATTVTVKAALGQADNEIMKVTGHERTDTVHTYKRRADTLAMLDEGDFVDFDRALPELCEPGTFTLPVKHDDQPSDADLPAWLLAAPHGQPAALPANATTAATQPAALPAATPTQPAQSTGQSLATDLRIPRKTGGETYFIVKDGSHAQPLDMTENAAIASVVAVPCPTMSEPAGHTLAMLQAQIDALRAVVVGGLAAEVSRQVIAQLQTQSPPKRARQGKR